MASGDAQRAWFPELLDDLKDIWSNDIAWEELAVFCRYMTEKRQKTKEARGIRLPRMTCRKCGGRMVLPPISTRSALFALRKAEVIDESEFRKLDREWANHRKANGLDAYGNKPES